jgi:hypothetical protein
MLFCLSLSLHIIFFSYPKVAISLPVGRQGSTKLSASTESATGGHKASFKHLTRFFAKRLLAVVVLVIPLVLSLE